MLFTTDNLDTNVVFVVKSQRSWVFQSICTIHMNSLQHRIHGHGNQPSPCNDPHLGTVCTAKNSVWSGLAIAVATPWQAKQRGGDLALFSENKTGEKVVLHWEWAMTEVVFSGAVTTIVILVGLLVVDSHFDADRIDSTPVKFGIERRFVLIIHYTAYT